MLPFSKASMSWGRFASSVRASASGFRLPAPRNWMTDGCREERTASSVPKISIRRHDDSMVGGSVLEDHFVVGVLQSQFANMDCIMTGPCCRKAASAGESALSIRNLIRPRRGATLVRGRLRPQRAAPHGRRQPRGRGTARGYPLWSALRPRGQRQSQRESEDREDTELPPSGGDWS